MKWKKQGVLAAAGAAAAMCICIPRPALAGLHLTEEHSENFSLQVGQSQTVSLPQFDNQGGCRELQNVTLEVDSDICNDSSACNIGQTTCQGTLSLDLTGTVDLLNLSCGGNYSDTFNSTPFGPGACFDFPQLCGPIDCTDRRTENLGPYQGQGTIDAELSSIPIVTFISGCNFQLTSVSTWTGTIKVIYTYRLVSESCCLPDGNCIEVCPADCTSQNGTPGGPGSTCDLNPCPTEACCLADGNCVDVIPRDCTDIFGGTPQGPGSTCATTPCPTEACCLPDGNCTDVIPRDCTDIFGGTPQGPGTFCDGTKCPTEACCLPDGNCTEVIPRDCTDIFGGTPQGPGSTCATTQCPPQACCLPDGNCIEIIARDCTDQGGTPQGPGSTCATTQCPTEACCLPDGNCLDLIPRDCTDLNGTPQGPGSTCATTQCPTQACCLADGNCIDVIVRDCTDLGGTPQGPGSTCATAQCPTEACCLPDGSCQDLILRDCTDLGGTPQGPGSICASTQCAGAGEGCTPGYWKQPQHFDDWAAPYDPTDLFSAFFENAFPGKTLLQVLSQPASAPPGPNQLNNLGRHTVAALLNAAAGLNFPFTPQEVIDMFNAVFPGTPAEYTALKNVFAAANADGLVNVNDLLTVMANWGTAGPGDANQNGVVNATDFLLVLNWWGS